MSSHGGVGGTTGGGPVAPLTLFDRFTAQCPAHLDSIRQFAPGLLRVPTSSDAERNDDDAAAENEEVWVAVFRSNNNQPSVLVRDEFLHAMRSATGTAAAAAPTVSAVGHHPALIVQQPNNNNKPSTSQRHSSPFSSSSLWRLFVCAEPLILPLEKSPSLWSSILNSHHALFFFFFVVAAVVVDRGRSSVRGPPLLPVSQCSGGNGRRSGSSGSGSGSNRTSSAVATSPRSSGVGTSGIVVVVAAPPSSPCPLGRFVVRRGTAQYQQQQARPQPPQLAPAQRVLLGTTARKRQARAGRRTFFLCDYRCCEPPPPSAPDFEKVVEQVILKRRLSRRRRLVFRWLQRRWIVLPVHVHAIPAPPSPCTTHSTPSSGHAHHADGADAPPTPRALGTVCCDPSSRLGTLVVGWQLCRIESRGSVFECLVDGHTVRHIVSPRDTARCGISMDCQ